MRALLILLAWSIVLPARGEQSDASPPETWHCTAYVHGPMGIRVIDYWSKGAEMRARTLIEGHPITTIVSAGRYVVFDELTGQGVDIERAAAAVEADGSRLRPFAFELDEMRAQGGEKIEEVAIGGVKGEIWQIRDTQGRRKLWVTTGAPRVPLRLETFDRASGDTIELDYQSWIFDLPMPDSFFRPPEGPRLERFDQAGWLQRGADGVGSTVPILYPDLLFGTPPASR